MARKILGTIKDNGGQPLQGLRVRAWDDDMPDDNDFMGEDKTDGLGKYEINYADGHWDFAPHNITTWRPDIFVTVQTQNNVGGWTEVARSATYKNHKLANDLGLNFNVDVAKIEKKDTGFDPVKHGFHFANSFVLNPDLFGISLGKWHMGFCAGMSAGGRNRFKNGQNAPPDTVTPKQGSALFAELLDRQKKCMSAGTLARIYEWQASPDEPHTFTPHSVGWRTKQQWPTLKHRLDAGEPTVLVLIRVEGVGANPTDNHQVLAIGYDWNETTKDLTVRLYDPNHADRTPTISMNLGMPNIHGKQSTGERMRGFFVNPDGDAAAA